MGYIIEIKDDITNWFINSCIGYMDRHKITKRRWREVWDKLKVWCSIDSSKGSWCQEVKNILNDLDDEVKLENIQSI